MNSATRISISTWDAQETAHDVFQRVRDALYHKEAQAILQGLPISYFLDDLKIEEGVVYFETVNIDGIETAEEVPVEDLIGGSYEDYKEISISL